MIPRVTQGSSFKGAFQYYMHDKNAQTRERIGWTSTVNMYTDDPDKAWKVMAYTAKHQDRLKQASGQKATGRKTEKPVMAYSLSWHPDLKPDRNHMQEFAMDSIKALGLEEHEAVIIAHTDTPHRHVHVVVNRIHPISGLVASNSNSYRKLSKLALEYCRKHNLDYCPQREKNAKKREQGKATKYRDTKIQEAWNNSDNGKSFVAALKTSGFQLARGNKRLVVVDQYGKTHNPVRHIEGIKTKDLNARLKDINRDTLPDATELAREMQAKHEEKKRQYLTSKDRLTNEFKKAAKKESKPPEPSEQNNQWEQHRTEQLNQLQDRHIKERANLSDHHHRKISHAKERLEHTYKFKATLNEIWQLQERCKTHNFWQKLTGKAKRDHEDLHALKLTFKNSKTRYTANIQGMEKDYARAKENLLEKQKEQRRFAAEVVFTRLPKHLERERSEERRQISRKRDGYSRGMGR